MHELKPLGVRARARRRSYAVHKPATDAPPLVSSINVLSRSNNSRALASAMCFPIVASKILPTTLAS